MKKLYGIALMSMFLAVAAPTWACGHGAKGQQNYSEKRVEKMAKKLELSEQQKEVLTKIMTDAKVSKDALDERYKMQQYREEKQALRKDSQQKINAILSPEQQEKMQKMHDKRQEKMHKKREK